MTKRRLLVLVFAAMAAFIPMTMRSSSAEMSQEDWIEVRGWVEDLRSTAVSSSDDEALLYLTGAQSWVSYFTEVDPTFTLMDTFPIQGE